MSFKIERHFDSWYLVFHIMAHSHEVTDVLDENYVPGAVATEWFDYKLYFTYTVLHNTLKTGMGTTLK
jgi:hypothetical protein